MAEEVRDVDFEMPRDPISVGRARTWFWRGSRADAGWSREMKSRLVDLEVGWLSRVVWKVRLCADHEAVCAGAISQNASPRDFGLGLWEFCASLNCELGPKCWK